MDMSPGLGLGYRLQAIRRKKKKSGHPPCSLTHSATRVAESP